MVSLGIDRASSGYLDWMMDVTKCGACRPWTGDFARVGLRRTDSPENGQQLLLRNQLLPALFERTEYLLSFIPGEIFFIEFFPLS